MASDRFIRFKKERPTKNQIRKILKLYISGIGSVEWRRDRFFVKIDGKPNNPLSAILPKSTPQELRDERWFEVYIGKNNDQSFDVITREADFLTRTLANGFVEFICFYCSAETLGV